MNIRIFLLLAAPVVVLIGSGGFASEPGGKPNQEEIPPFSSSVGSHLELERISEPIRQRFLPVERAASCASTACHGGPRAGVSEPFAPRGAEYPLWLENDPHAQSWRTICSSESLAMLERLSIVRDGKVINAAAMENCLACHNTSRDDSTSSRGAQVADTPLYAKHDALREGVGCASCHGSSEAWRTDHYRIQRDDASRLAVGMLPNKNLLARARACASCHVGDSDRDMNHDIIAAGHPAQHYEFATFHQMLPKHWREENAGEFEAKLWLAGQIAGLDASLALFQSRAAGQLPVSVWPEFSASECSSCHQNLRLGTDRYATASATAVAEYSSWNRFGVEQLLTTASDPSDATQSALLQALDKLSMRMGETALPDAEKIQRDALAARVALDQWLRSSGNQLLEEFTAVQLKELAVVSLRDPANSNSWEFAAQGYLAAIAARQSWLDSRETQRTTDALALRSMLLFRPNTGSLALLDTPERDALEFAGRLAESLERSCTLFDAPRPPGSPPPIPIQGRSEFP